MLTFEQKQAILTRLPDFMLLANSDEAVSSDRPGALLVENVGQVLSAREMGLDRKRVFYVDPERDGLEDVLDKCRIVVSSMDSLRRVNDAAAVRGCITMVGLTLAAEGFSDSTGIGITTEELRSMVHEIKQLEHVSVCGCMVLGDAQGLHGKDLGKLIRSSYQTAKTMTYILPCSMPYIWVANCLEAIARNEAEHPEDFEAFLTTANIVGMQNTTAFYADYYLQ